jgi:hypothetical protein
MFHQSTDIGVRDKGTCFQNWAIRLVLGAPSSAVVIPAPRVPSLSAILFVLTTMSIVQIALLTTISRRIFIVIAIPNKTLRCAQILVDASFCVMPHRHIRTPGAPRHVHSGVVWSGQKDYVLMSSARLALLFVAVRPVSPILVVITVAIPQATLTAMAIHVSIFTPPGKPQINALFLAAHAVIVQGTRYTMAIAIVVATPRFPWKHAATSFIASVVVKSVARRTRVAVIVPDPKPSALFLRAS